MNDALKIPVSNTQLALINEGTGKNYIHNVRFHDWDVIEVFSTFSIGTTTLKSDDHIVLIRGEYSRVPISIQAHELIKQFNLIRDEYEITGYFTHLIPEAMSSTIAVLSAVTYPGCPSTGVIEQHLHYKVRWEEVIFVPKRHRR